MIKSGLGTEAANLFQFLCGGASHAPPALLWVRRCKVDWKNHFALLKFWID
jgi:hypothetical protein